MREAKDQGEKSKKQAEETEVPVERDGKIVEITPAPSHSHSSLPFFPSAHPLTTPSPNLHILQSF
jgi:hypothetical protein